MADQQLLRRFARSRGPRCAGPFLFWRQTQAPWPLVVRIRRNRQRPSYRTRAEDLARLHDLRTPLVVLPVVWKRN